MRSIIRTVTPLLAFVFGVVACTICINALFPYERPRIIQSKLSDICDLDDTNMIFVGTSRIHHQVYPSLFDRTAAERGLMVKSYNLAVFGMESYELDVALRQALKCESYKYIVVEDRPDSCEIPPANRHTNRAIWWHTPIATFRLINDVWSSELSIRDRFFKSLPHIEHAFIRQFYVGGWKTMRLRRKLDHASPTHDPGRGYSPISPKSVSEDVYLRRRKALIDDPDLINRSAAQLRKRYEVGETRRLAPGELQYLSRLWILAEEHSAYVIHVTVPGSWTPPVDLSSVQVPPHVFQVNLNDPTRYPRLFQDEMWVDPGHLNADGANIHTSYLAEAIADKLSESTN